MPEPQILKIQVTEVLDWYDGPLCVQARTLETREPVFAIVVDELADGTRIWLAVRVAPETIQGLLRNEISLRDAFTIRRIGNVYISETIKDKGRATIAELLKEPSDDWLPAQSVFLRYQPVG